MSRHAYVAAAYDWCEAVTRKEAKNFAYGIRLLRTPERRAMSAVYAFARRIDDVGDGDGAPSAKLAGLTDLRRQVADVEAGRPGSDPVLVAVNDAHLRYELPMGAFAEIIDGCEMDVLGTTYKKMDDLVAYCRLVAGSVGRLSLAIFGTSDAARAVPLADSLGVALQLTNILRDVVEDREMGRVYLPAEDAAAAGCPGDLSGDTASVARLVERECKVARQWFDEGLQLLGLLDRRSRACTAAMAGIYLRLLDMIEADPESVTKGRVSVPTREKLLVAARAVSGKQL